MMQFYYFNNSSEQGITTTEEIKNSFGDKFNAFTWIRKPNEVYWTPLIQYLPLLPELYWDYSHNEITYRKIPGKEILALDLPKKTLIWPSNSSQINTLNYFFFSKTLRSYPYHGYSCLPPEKHIHQHMNFLAFPFTLLISASLVYYTQSFYAFILTFFFYIMGSVISLFTLIQYGWIPINRLFGVYSLSYTGQKLTLKESINYMAPQKYPTEPNIIYRDIGIIETRTPPK